MHVLQQFLLRRLDQPWAWMVVFATAGCIAGCVSGGAQGGLSGALLLAMVGGIVGLIVGAMFGCSVWLILRLAGGLDQPVRSPELWGIPFSCPACGWSIGPEGPWTRRDCMSWPTNCPLCAHALIIRIPSCACCGETRRSGWRIPKSVRMAIAGGYLCSGCGSEQDKWGRTIKVGAASASGAQEE